MPQAADDPISQASQGTNWLVGLSGAAVGGALAKLDWVLKFPKWGKIGFLVASLCFMFSILVGVFYAFQLFALKLRKQKLEEEKAKPSPVQADIDAAKQRLDQANEKVAQFHYLTMAAFALACLATVACLGVVLFQPAAATKPLKPESAPIIKNAYALTNLPVHVGGQLSHSHTFLLNQQTGAVWQMTCRKGSLVEFHRVLRTGLNGSPDDDPATPINGNAQIAPSN
jgi:hypothetical protein